MTAKQKLELTWVGKDNRPRLEPRILLEDRDRSYHARHRVTEADVFDNMLIHGDNLLALKALEQDYSGKAKCVYIDPPFNTEQALEYYQDGLDHSIWLGLIRDRLEIIRKLMSEDATLFVHIDDNELGYLIVLLDELFGRDNRVAIVTFKQGAATGHKAINPGVVSTSNFIVIYAKTKAAWSPNRLFTARAERDKRYTQYIENIDGPCSDWRFITLTSGFAGAQNVPERELKKVLGDKYEEELSAFVIKNAHRVVQLARPDYDAVSNDARKMIDESRSRTWEVLRLERPNFSDMYFKGGQRILFYADKLKLIDGQYVAGEPLTTIWDDVLSNNLHNEGGVEFPKGKKPEALIKRCLELSTARGDLILDSFGGSGTTAAVAHKMGRRWITVELGEQCNTHIIPRLKRVIDNTDVSGVTQAVGWKGGGGFRCFALAPSLLRRDKWGRDVISKAYNAEMLSEALCKLEGFKYQPSDTDYWQHGYSTERDFIYVTTQALGASQLADLSEEVGPDRTLLVLCGAFRGTASNFANLTVRKIPNHIRSRCEWGHDDYSLNVENLPKPIAEPAQQFLFGDAAGNE